MKTKVKFTTNLNGDLIKLAKIKAIEENKSVGNIIEELLTTYLEDRGNNYESKIKQ